MLEGDWEEWLPTVHDLFRELHGHHDAVLDHVPEFDDGFQTRVFEVAHALFEGQPQKTLVAVEPVQHKWVRLLEQQEQVGQFVQLFGRLQLQQTHLVQSDNMVDGVDICGPRIVNSLSTFINKESDESDNLVEV